MENKTLSRAQEAKLARLAEEFFAGDEQPLPGISARGAENRLAAMKTLQSIYAALPGAGPVFANLEEEAPYVAAPRVVGSWLRIVTDHESISEFPGYEADEFLFKRISLETYEERRTRAEKGTWGEVITPWPPLVPGSAPEGTEGFCVRTTALCSNGETVVLDDGEWSLFLKAPLGLAGCYQIERRIEIVRH